MLQSCHENNQEDAQLLLLRGVEEFENVTPLQVSEIADSKSFLNSTCTQSLLAKIWYGQIYVDAPKFYVCCFNFYLFRKPFILRLFKLDIFFNYTTSFGSIVFKLRT